MQKRKFTGIWISKEVLDVEGLNAIDKFLYAEIECFDDDGKGSCWASNEYFAELLGVSIPTITRSIAKLIEKKLIKIDGFDGRNRSISLIKMMRQPNQNETLPNQNDEARVYKRDNRYNITEKMTIGVRLTTHSASGIPQRTENILRAEGISSQAIAILGKDIGTIVSLTQSPSFTTGRRLDDVVRAFANLIESGTEIPIEKVANAVKAWPTTIQSLPKEKRSSYMKMGLAGWIENRGWELDGGNLKSWKQESIQEAMRRMAQHQDPI